MFSSGFSGGFHGFFGFQWFPFPWFPVVVSMACLNFEHGFLPTPSRFSFSCFGIVAHTCLFARPPRPPALGFHACQGSSHTPVCLLVSLHHSYPSSFSFHFSNQIYMYFPSALTLWSSSSAASFSNLEVTLKGMLVGWFPCPRSLHPSQASFWPTSCLGSTPMLLGGQFLRDLRQWCILELLARVFSEDLGSRFSEEPRVLYRTCPNGVKLILTFARSEDDCLKAHSLDDFIFGHEGEMTSVVQPHVTDPEEVFWIERTPRFSWPNSRREPMAWFRWLVIINILERSWFGKSTQVKLVCLRQLVQWVLMWWRLGWTPAEISQKPKTERSYIFYNFKMS